MTNCRAPKNTYLWNTKIIFDQFEAGEIVKEPLKTIEDHSYYQRFNSIGVPLVVPFSFSSL